MERPLKKSTYIVNKKTEIFTEVIKRMVSLVSQSGQKMANICTWIADSIEDMINAAAMSYARPGSECLVISQDNVTKKWSLKKYVLCPNRRDWALIEENTDATVIGPDG
jgi:predicted hydrolase (HD superfamily)